MSPDNSNSSKLISAPEVVAKYVYINKQGKPSLQSQMGLEGDRGQLDAMTAMTREAAVQQFDLRPATFREQQPEVLQTVRDMVARRYAGLERYENGWPVSRYIAIYLKNLHVKKGQKSPGRKSTSSTTTTKAPRKTSAKAQPVSESRRIRPGQRRNSAGFVLGHATKESGLEPRGGNTLAGRGSASRVSTSILTPLVSSAHLSIRPHSSPEVEYYNPLGPKAQSESIVHAFLQSLRMPGPDTVRIMELFEIMGIRTQDYLELFATMETRNAWLHELVASGDLTPIQMRLLREGLDRVTRDI